MAEIKDFPVKRGTILRLSDGAGSPKTYEIVAIQGEYTIQNGGHNLTRMRDTDGDLEEITKKAEQAGPSSIAITAKFYDPGANNGEAVLHDILRGGGYFANDWVTTAANPGSDYKHFKVEVIVPALQGGAKASVTYSLAAAVARDDFAISVGAEGFSVSATFESNAAQVTVA